MFYRIFYNKEWDKELQNLLDTRDIESVNSRTVKFNGGSIEVWIGDGNLWSVNGRRVPYSILSLYPSYYTKRRLLRRVQEFLIDSAWV